MEDEREVRLFKITEIEGTEVKRVLKNILEKYNDIISQKAYNIENCQIIKYIIRLLDKTPVMGKQGN